MFTVLAVLLLDRVGRRPLLIGGTVGLTVALTVLGVFFQVAALQHGASWLALVALLVFMASFAIGLGPVFWLMISEIFPLRYRSHAMAVSTVGNWAANFLVSYFFLSFVSWIGKSGTFWLYAGLGIAATAFFWVKVPETKGRSLEEVERKHARRVLEMVGGNKAQAAEILGISRSTLYNLLDEVAEGSSAKSS